MLHVPQPNQHGICWHYGALRHHTLRTSVNGTPSSTHLGMTTQLLCRAQNCDLMWSFVLILEQYVFCQFFSLLAHKRFVKTAATALNYSFSEIFYQCQKRLTLVKCELRDQHLILDMDTQLYTHSSPQSDATFRSDSDGCITHWGRVTHICASQFTINGSDNGLSPGRHQAIIWTNAGILLIWTLRKKLQRNLNRNQYIFIQETAFEKVVWKMAAILSRPQCVQWCFRSIKVSRNHLKPVKLERTHV